MDLFPFSEKKVGMHLFSWVWQNAILNHKTQTEVCIFPHFHLRMETDTSSKTLFLISVDEIHKKHI